MDAGSISAVSRQSVGSSWFLGGRGGRFRGSERRIVWVESLGPPLETLGALKTQRLTGTAYMEVDPRDPLNAIIVDIDKAPKNARGTA